MRDFNQASIPVPKLEFSFPLAVQHYAGFDLEIGAGQGLHAIQYCQANPHRRLIAVEKTHARFASLKRRHDQHSELENLVALHADAVAFVSHFLPPRSIDRVFLLYPNPHAKAKQANLRWHNRPFLAELLNKMKPGAELTIATNLDWYAKEAEATLLGQWRLERLEFAEIEKHQSPRTHFEKKYLLRGEGCWNLKFRKPL